MNGFGISFEVLMALVYVEEIWEFHDNVMPMIEIVIITVFVLMTGKQNKINISFIFYYFLYSKYSAHIFGGLEIVFTIATKNCQ